jgi:hypothetical protein
MDYLFQFVSTAGTGRQRNKLSPYKARIELGIPYVLSKGKKTKMKRNGDVEAEKKCREVGVS